MTAPTPEVLTSAVPGEVPEWAIERACALANVQGQNEHWTVREVLNGLDYPHRYPAITAFARYIAANEEAPVDPLLIEARKIVRAYYPEMGDDYRGRRMNIASAALRRGIELGQAHGHD